MRSSAESRPDCSTLDRSRSCETRVRMRGGGPPRTEAAPSSRWENWAPFSKTESAVTLRVPPEEGGEGAAEIFFVATRWGGAAATFFGPPMRRVPVLGALAGAAAFLAAAGLSLVVVAAAWGCFFFFFRGERGGLREAQEVEEA